MSVDPNAAVFGRHSVAHLAGLDTIQTLDECDPGELGEERRHRREHGDRSLPRVRLIECGEIPLGCSHQYLGVTPCGERQRAYVRDRSELAESLLGFFEDGRCRFRYPGGSAQACRVDPAGAVDRNRAVGEQIDADEVVVETDVRRNGE